MPKFRTNYISPRFGALFQEYLRNIPETSDKINRRDFNGLAGVVLRDTEIKASVSTMSPDLRAFCKGNIVGRNGYVTIRSRTIRDYLLRLFYVLNSLEVPSDSEMISLLRNETGINDLDYPPTEEYPNGYKNPEN